MKVKHNEEIKIIWGSKKDFDDKFGDEHGMHIPSKEIWEWINANYTPNEQLQQEKEQYLGEFVKQMYRISYFERLELKKKVKQFKKEQQ